MHYLVPGVNLGLWIWMIINWLIPIGVVALVVVGIVLILRRRDQAAAVSQRSGDRALEILRERYARGELSEEEYDRRRAKLQNDR